MTNPTESDELAAHIPAKARSSVNAAKKTLRIFGSAPGDSGADTRELEAGDFKTPEKTPLSEGKEQLEPVSARGKQKQDRRVLRPEFKTKFLNQLSEALGIRQTADLPKIFLAERVMPMKIGIANDLIARYPNAQDHKTVKKTLGFLVRSFTYSNAVIEEERRYDLDLNPIFDETGEITDQSRIDAQHNIKNGLAKIKKRRAGLAQ
ncbi:MAG: ProQ/FINO family protein [Pseudomonadota bacterium]